MRASAFKSMNGQEAIAYIHSLYGMGKKEGLSNTRMLMRLLGGPERRLKMVHVAGTNGKGSTCAMLESMLRAQGYKTGLYTSPYLQFYNERIRINFKPVSDEVLARAVERVKTAADYMRDCGLGRPTEFEVGTATAFCVFEQEQVDYAVIEVGLGGRLDPTNVITPLVSVITSISLDHTKILGQTREAIAREKAGIAKPGVPLVVYRQATEILSAIEQAAQLAGAPVYVADAPYQVSLDAHGAVFDYKSFTRVRINLPGAHQTLNAATALEAALQLRAQGVALADKPVRAGLRHCVWPGRLEWIGDNVLIDGAHNPNGAAALGEFISRHLPGCPIALVCGILRDKDYEGIVSRLAPRVEKAFTVSPESHRALDKDELAAVFERHGTPAQSCGSVSEAIELARSFAGGSGCVLIAGSLYLAGEARSLLTQAL